MVIDDRFASKYLDAADRGLLVWIEGDGEAPGVVTFDSLRRARARGQEPRP